MNRPITDSLIQMQLDPDRLLPVYDLCFGSAEGFDFVFTGDVSAEIIEPLIEKYIAGLPSGKEVAVGYKYNGPQILRQDSVFQRSVGDNPRASVIIYSQNDDALSDIRRTKMVGEITSAVIRTKLLASLREEMNMIYSVSVNASLTAKSSDLNRVSVSFSCKPEDVDTLIKRTFADMEMMVADPSQFEAELSDVKLNSLKKYKTDLQTTRFWTSGLREVLYYDFPDWTYLTDYDKLIESVTVDQIADYIDRYMLHSYQLKAILLPKENSDPTEIK